MSYPSIILCKNILLTDYLKNDIFILSLINTDSKVTLTSAGSVSKMSKSKFKELLPIVCNELGCSMYWISSSVVDFLPPADCILRMLHQLDYVTFTTY